MATRAAAAADGRLSLTHPSSSARPWLPCLGDAKFFTKIVQVGQSVRHQEPSVVDQRRVSGLQDLGTPHGRVSRSLANTTVHCCGHARTRRDRCHHWKATQRHLESGKSSVLELGCPCEPLFHARLCHAFIGGVVEG